MLPVPLVADPPDEEDRFMNVFDRGKLGCNYIHKIEEGILRLKMSHFIQNGREKIEKDREREENGRERERENCDEGTN